MTQKRRASLFDKLKSKYSDSFRNPAPPTLPKQAHSIWELRPSEDEPDGYVLTRKREERAVDLGSPRQHTASTECKCPNQLTVGMRGAIVRSGQLMPVIVLKMDNQGNVELEDEDGGVMPATEDELLTEPGGCQCGPECQCCEESAVASDLLAPGMFDGPMGCDGGEGGLFDVDLDGGDEGDESEEETEEYSDEDALDSNGDGEFYSPDEGSEDESAEHEDEESEGEESEDASTDVSSGDEQKEFTIKIHRAVRRAIRQPLPRNVPMRNHVVTEDGKTTQFDSYSAWGKDVLVDEDFTSSNGVPVSSGTRWTVEGISNPSSPSAQVRLVSTDAHGDGDDVILVPQEHFKTYFHSAPAVGKRNIDSPYDSSVDGDGDTRGLFEDGGSPQGLPSEEMTSDLPMPEKPSRFTRRELAEGLNSPAGLPTGRYSRPSVSDRLTNMDRGGPRPPTPTITPRGPSVSNSTDGAMEDAFDFSRITPRKR